MRMNPPTLPANYAPAVYADELIQTLELIAHATAPIPDDGGHHENAYELAMSVLKRVEARREYESEKGVDMSDELNRRAQPVAPGWVLVPVEPTPEMIEAYVNQPGKFASAKSDWAAMLEAAPNQRAAQPPAEPADARTQYEKDRDRNLDSADELLFQAKTVSTDTKPVAFRVKLAKPEGGMIYAYSESETLLKYMGKVEPLGLIQEPRPEFLALAESCGAVITGKPDGSEPITIVFTIDAWRKFDGKNRLDSRAATG